MTQEVFSELDLTTLLSLSFSTSINELHDRLRELGFADIRPVHGFMFMYCSKRSNRYRISRIFRNYEASRK